MKLMRHWAAIITAEQFTTERLYARDVIEILPAGEGGTAAEDGDTVALLAASDPAALFGHGRVVGRSAAGGVLVAYARRAFDDPPPAPADVLPTGVPAVPGLFPLPAAQYTRLSTLVSAAASAVDGRSVWLVSVALPIEASTRAEAVREFWTYVDKLGPAELPAYVWPLGDELSMQAYVLGELTNLDPEEDDDGP
jgi:hypothetical protein